MTRRTAQREHITQKAALDYLKLRNIPHLRANAGLFRSIDGKRVIRGADAGTSDIVALIPRLCACGAVYGAFGALECKRRGEGVEPEQDVFLGRVEEMGGVAAVLYSLDDLIAVIEAGR